MEQFNVDEAPPAVAYAVMYTVAPSASAVAVPVENVQRDVSAVVPFVPMRSVKVDAAVPAAVLLMTTFQVIFVPFVAPLVDPWRPPVGNRRSEDVTYVSLPAVTP